MSSETLYSAPHRRFNPLLREWVLVSPQRLQRPWQGKLETAQSQPALRYDPTCYLCPGNVRANGRRNPQYGSTLVFENDFPALLADVSAEVHDDSGLIVSRAEKGICLVGCFSPRHDLSIGQMTIEEVRRVADLWAEYYASLAGRNWIHHVQVFENRGALMGASNPHPHCQIWANETIPDDPRRELESFADYFREKRSCLLCDYVQLELKLSDRLVLQNQHFVALVPYWAIWPFELLVVPKQHRLAIVDLPSAEMNSLAEILRNIVLAYDRLFQTQFPYSMGFHQNPTNQTTKSECHLHAHYYPPLLRSATVQKFMVGYELLANPQRDVTPEMAAAMLRNVAPTRPPGDS